jgi:hypothetical protein
MALPSDEEEVSMAEQTEQEIKARAYKIWERLGCPPGKEDECWALGEQELRNEDNSGPLGIPKHLT